MNKKKIYSYTVALGAFLLLFTSVLSVQAITKDRLVKTSTDHKVFLVQNNRRIHIPSPSVFEAGGYTWGDIKTISNWEMESIRNTALIKSPIDAKVYLIKDGKKAWIPNEDAFLGAGLRWDDIVLITQAQVDFYPNTYFRSEDAQDIAREESKQQIVLKAKEAENTGQEYQEPVAEDVQEDTSYTAPQREVYLAPDTLQVRVVASLSDVGAALDADINNNGDMVVLDDISTRVITYDDGSEQKMYTSKPLYIKDGVKKHIAEYWRVQLLSDNNEMIAVDTTGPGHPVTVYLSNGERTRMATLGGHTNEVAAMNSQGQVVGSSELPVPAGGDSGSFAPFLWENGVISRLPQYDGHEWSPQAIIESGAIAGTVYLNDGTPGGEHRVVLLDNGVVRYVGQGFATDMNEHGVIVGRRGFFAYAWKDGIASKLETPAGYNSRAVAIADNGDILGAMNLEYSYGYEGDVDFKDWTREESGEVVLWRSGQLIRLNDYAPAGYLFVQPLAMNDRGELLVRGLDAEREEYQILLIQLPDNL